MERRALVYIGNEIIVFFWILQKDFKHFNVKYIKLSFNKHTYTTNQSFKKIIENKKNF